MKNSQNNSKNNDSTKLLEDMKRHSTKEDIMMASKLMK